MSKELHIALQEAIGDLGTDVLKSPHLVNILQDYGAFDVHDKKSLAIKQRLAELVKDGAIEEISSWRKLSDKKIQSNGLSLLKRYNDDNDVRYIVDCVLKACGLPALSLSSVKTQANSLPPPKTTIVPKINATQTKQSKPDNKSNGKNIGCALFGLLLFLPCALILFSMSEIVGGIGCMIGALICIIGPFANPDFWEWNGY